MESSFRFDVSQRPSRSIFDRSSTSFEMNLQGRSAENRSSNNLMDATHSRRSNRMEFAIFGRQNRNFIPAHVHFLLRSMTFCSSVEPDGRIKAVTLVRPWAHPYWSSPSRIQGDWSC